jgi:hypothetical protein
MSDGARCGSRSPRPRSSQALPSARSASLAHPNAPRDGTDQRRPSRLPADARPLPPSTTSTASLGARFWGQVRGSSGRLRVLRGKVATRRETIRIAGKALYQAHLRDRIASGRILHGKERVTVRVRQSASIKCLQMGTLLLSVRKTRGHISDTSAVRATHRDVSRRLPTHVPHAVSSNS